MALRQMHTAETMFIDDGLTDGASFPPSSNAVYDALQSAIELPSVTATDDGDVLTVVDGAWAKATPSGGGGVLETEMTFSGTTITFDISYNDVKSAVDDGKAIVWSCDNYPVGEGASGEAKGVLNIGMVMEYEDDGTPTFIVMIVVGASDQMITGTDFDADLSYSIGS